MPRIARPSDANEKAPREFALLAQIAPGEQTSVDLDTLATFQKLYGNVEQQIPEGDSIDFSTFKELFSRPPTVPTAGDPKGNAVGYAAHDPSGHLSPFGFTRRDVGPQEIRIQITHASICHSDIHFAKDEWKFTTYPIVPGHEIVGIVTKIGKDVTKFKIGDRAGVGCIVNSCRSCETCKDGHEQYCTGCILTYNGTDVDGTMTRGGYSTHYVITQDFALHIPDNLPLEAAAPLLCAGITVFSPLLQSGLLAPGKKLGVAGLGGLGAHAVAFAKSKGCEVTLISTSQNKEKEAKEGLKADHFLLRSNAEAMTAAARTLDGIMDTIPASHDLGPYLSLLKTGGQILLVGIPTDPNPLPMAEVTFRRLTLKGSLIGSIGETQEMLDYCAKQSPPLYLPYETIDAKEVNEAYARVLKNDVRYRFVINVQGTLVLQE